MSEIVRIWSVISERLWWRFWIRIFKFALGKVFGQVRNWQPVFKNIPLFMSFFLVGLHLDYLLDEIRSWWFKMFWKFAKKLLPENSYSWISYSYSKFSWNSDNEPCFRETMFARLIIYLLNLCLLIRVLLEFCLNFSTNSLYQRENDDHDKILTSNLWCLFFTFLFCLFKFCAMIWDDEFENFSF